MKDIAFWYQSKNCLLIPKLGVCFEFYVHEMEWRIQAHYRDDETYDWGKTSREHVKPRLEGNLYRLGCAESRKNGNLCPFLDMSCCVRRIMTRIPSFADPRDAMDLWRLDLNQVERLEVINRL